ncbi:hypothetical protein [Terricaulis sp.]|uniref:hypothetical protein n=1 Tax=Terricaulis sp. TaxID=2768686 RepID=UPI003783E62F
MTPRRLPFLKQHRFARIVLWATAMLAWLASMLLTDAAPASRRRIRQRYGFASLAWARRLLRGLAVMRAVELSGIAKKPQASLRNAAPAGFRRRIVRGAIGRAVAGARFRRALKAQDLRTRIQLLRAAFADIDGFARRYLLRRVLRRLTKLCAVIPRAPPAQELRVLAVSEPRAADSS